MLEIYTIYCISPLPRDLHVNGFLGYDSRHKGYVGEIQLLITFGFPVVFPSMSFILSSPMLTPLMSLFTFF
jgi:hypothetical protein